MVHFLTMPPEINKISRKALLVIKARVDTREAGFPTGVQNEVVFMEMNKPILDNLYNVCSVSCNGQQLSDLSKFSLARAVLRGKLICLCVGGVPAYSELPAEPGELERPCEQRPHGEVPQLPRLHLRDDRASERLYVVAAAAGGCDEHRPHLEQGQGPHPRE